MRSLLGQIFFVDLINLFLQCSLYFYTSLVHMHKCWYTVHNMHPTYAYVEA